MLIKNENFCPVKRMEKEKPQSGLKYIQTTCLIKDYHIENIKNSQNSAVENNPIRKWTKYTKGQCIQEGTSMESKHVKNKFSINS